MSMLDAEKSAQVNKSITGVAARVSQLVAETDDVWQTIDVVKSVHSSIDKVVVAQSATLPAPECKPGCCFCCSARVEVSDAEALHIARHVHEWPQAKRDGLREQLGMQASRRANAPDSERFPCSFLEQGLCSIYAHRPSTCRKAHSLSASACEHLAPQIPQNLGLSLQSEVLIEGFNRAFLANHLPSQKNELSAAVFAALGSDHVFEDWYQGKPLLEPTRLPKQ